MSADGYVTVTLLEKVLQVSPLMGVAILLAGAAIIVGVLWVGVTILRVVVAYRHRWAEDIRRKGRAKIVMSSADVDDFLRTGRDRKIEWGLLGTTVSHRTQNEYLIGFAYFDLKTNQADDLYRADLLALDLRYFPRGTYERVNPAYLGTHHGAKPYLPTALDPIQ